MNNLCGIHFQNYFLPGEDIYGTALLGGWVGGGGGGGGLYG